MKFKVGDRVCYKRQNPGDNVEVGEIGTICGVSDETGKYGVAFEIKDIGKHSCDGLCRDNYGWWCDENTLEPVVSTLAEIKEKKLTCCIDVKNIAEAQFLDDFFECKSYLRKYCENAYKERMRLGYCRTLEDGVAFQLTEGVINDCCSANFYRSCGGRYGEVYEFSDLFSVGSTMICGDRIYQRTESGITNYKLVPEYKEGGTASIHDLPTNEGYKHFTVVKDEIDALEHMANNVCVQVDITDFDAQRLTKRLADISTRLKKRPFDISTGLREEKNLKFTFYVTEGTRIDKSCNKTIPTMTTFVSIGRYHSGKATCDKADYDERQGCLEAIANAFLDGNFDREFNRAVKANELDDKKKRTCTYCGKVLNTVEERQEHEIWHVERKKARRERYLLRKRAKEIAFEEQAQKMAKEMIEEDK